MIAHHIVAQVSLVRVISWSSHDARISSTLSPSFPSTSSSSHSSPISCTSSCTSSTTLRAVVTLRTSPERRRTLLTTPTSSQVMSPSPTTSWRLMSSPSQSPWPTHSSLSKGSSRMWSKMTPRSRICFTMHTEYMSITPSQKACLSVSRRRPCPSERRDPLESEQGDLLDRVVRSYTLETHRLELCWTDRKSKSSPNARRRLRNTNSRLIMTEEVYENCDKLLNICKKNSIALKLKNFNDEINNFSMIGYYSKIRNFVKLIIKVSMKWKNYGNSRVLPSTPLQDENSSRIRSLFWNFRTRYRNCKMKLIVWMIQKIFRMLNQFAVEIPTLPVDKCHQILGGMLSRSIGMPSRREGPPSIWDTHGISGNVFLQIQMRPLQHLIRRNWIHGVLICRNQFAHQRRRRMRIKHPFRIRDASPDSQPKIHFIPCEGDSSKNYGADQQRLQISDPHFEKYPTPATFTCWKIRFRTEVCTCSQFPTEAIHWINEVEMEMAGSVDDFKSSSFVRGIRMPDFEVLDARIASALNRIIHNSHFKRRVSLEEHKAQKQDRFLRGRHIAYLIYEYFRVTRANDSVENYAELFTSVLRDDDIQEFDSKWDGISLSMTKIPPDDILEGLYKTKNTRVWKVQDRIGIVQYGDSSEESWSWLSQIENYGEKMYRARFTK